MRRTWIKLWVDQLLRGESFMQLNEQQRFVWIGLLLLAGDSAYPGCICLTEKIGYTDKQIAALLRTNKKLINETIKILEKQDKIQIADGSIIKITNWVKYQSDYQRQKPYRQKLLTEVTNESYKPKCVPIEKEIEKEKYINKDNIRSKVNKADLDRVLKSFFLGEKPEVKALTQEERTAEFKRWCKLYYPKWCKYAKQLIEYFGGWEKAARCALDLYAEFKTKNMDFSPSGVTKQASKWEQRQREAR